MRFVNTMLEDAAQVWSVYKSDTNLMGMLQLLCSERIKRHLQLVFSTKEIKAFSIVHILMLVLCTGWNQQSGVLCCKLICQ